MQQQEIKSVIQEAKKQVQKSLHKDQLLIFFTRVYEDLKKQDNPVLLGRVLELYRSIFPYEDSDNKQLLKKIQGNLTNTEGLQITEKEEHYIHIISKELKEDYTVKNPKVMKGRIKGIIDKLAQEYFPETSKVIEPYLLGKLIGSVGGIQRIQKMPSSTIQLIGAENALFRHKAHNQKSPKYGILYYSKYIQSQPNKGKTARQLSNKLAITLKVDYNRNILRQ